jgi:cytochrome P450
MSIDIGSKPTGNASIVPFYRFLAKHRRDPVLAFEEVGRQADGKLVRLNLGPFRPYLVTHPEHVQHVLRNNQPNYIREGMFWDPLIPLVGRGILSDGETWQESRQVLQPLFTAKYVDSLAEGMADTLAEQIEAVVRPGESFDVVKGISDIVHPTIVRLFFGDRISRGDIARLIPAYEVAVTATWPRLLMPFVPDSVPLPGDRAFRRSIDTINNVVYPRVHEARRTAGDGKDVVSAICRARADDLGEAGDRRIRDDMVSMHGAATDTSATALTWVWVVLDAYPEVAAKIYEEIDEVVGTERVRPSHLPELRYLKMFLFEVLRVYPPGWILPRKAVETDEIDGVTIKAGSTAMISPYITHRLPKFWDRPDDFDPERFAPEREGRHRWSYIPFGGGPHQCLGQHLFMMEAQLLLAGLLSRYRPVLMAAKTVRPRLASLLWPNQKVELTFVERKWA